MTEHRNELRLAITGYEALRTPAKVAAQLQGHGKSSLSSLRHDLSAEQQDLVEQQVDGLHQRDVRVVFSGDDSFPEALAARGRPAVPLLFYWGNSKLLHSRSIGMCGSRVATPLGLKAARSCGMEVARRGLAVVSGYAKGVDTETHLGALEEGGSTVIVLAEGFKYFRIKKHFKEHFDPERVLVVSQFAPRQPWGAYNAMARNHVIFGMSEGLVVIEAGDKGGTLAAGTGALRLGRPVFVLNFGDDTPVGNQMLLGQGGIPITSREALGAALDDAAARATVQEELPL